MFMEGRLNRYIAPTLAAGLLMGIGGTACGGKSKFELCKSTKFSNGQIVDSTGTWAERTADSLACFLESEQEKDPKGVRVTFRDGHEFIRKMRRAKSQIKEASSANHRVGTGSGEYELTAEIIGWPHGKETVESAEVLVNGGLKGLDPIYLLALFREHGSWSFDQEIVQKNGELASVDSGFPNVQKYQAEIFNLAGQVACQEKHDVPVDWISPDNIGSKQILSDCSAS